MNNNYYLNLEFTNAKFFYEKTLNDSPIDTWTIANVISVIFCQRPVNRKRPVSYTISDYYLEKAENSLMEIDYNKKKNIFPNNNFDIFSDYVIPDNVNLTKDIINSDVKSINCASWDYLKTILESYEYDYLINNVLKVILDYNPEDKSFIEARRDCKNLRLDYDDISKLYDQHKDNFKNGSKGIFNSLFKNKKYLDKKDNIEKTDYESTQINDKELSRIRENNRKNRPYGYSVLKTEPRSCIQLKGNIYIPINDNDIDFLKKYSTGHATILDGGLVRIKEILPVNFINKNDKIKFKKYETTN
jgi:hypothetical protein